MNLPRRREIIGTAVSITDYEEVLDAVDACIAADEKTFICCAPASTLVFARDDAELSSALSAAGIVTPDGMGVVHAARMLGEEIDDRVYGPDLMELQLARAADAGTPTFFYGGHDDAALDQLRVALAERFPGLNVVGGISPPHRPPTETEAAETASAINSSGARIVWVGLGSPKQEIWMHRNRERIEAPVMVGVGAAFDFLAGRTDQAPDWVQKRSLEWLYRIVKEPRRLLGRYLKTLPRFGVLVLRQRLRGR